MPGVDAEVQSKAPDGTLTLQLHDGTIALGPALADQLYVSLLTPRTVKDAPLEGVPPPRRSPSRILLRDFAERLARVHRGLLDEREGVVLRQAVLVHQHALGPVDHLARRQLVLEALVLLLERLHLGEPAEGDLDGGQQLVLLERLHEVGQTPPRRGPARSGRAG